ncbi:MAG: Stp1/IreP family PP2C-type Ser/Thr phosphatase [Clostridium sp.]|nr:Stp1/IreP family PP2C-type Ser/Thr phosphatase [Clostridium sp.]
MQKVKVMRAAGISHPGRVREKNEDGYLIWQQGTISLFAVADGMGGHAAGEVASTLALETIRQSLIEQQLTLYEKVADGCTIEPYLTEILTVANGKILLAGGNGTECVGMGTTLTLLLSVSGQAWIGHIGDSRAYLLRQGRLQMLTEDHTLVSQLARSGQISEEEKKNHPQRHILTQALGTEQAPSFDIQKFLLQAGDLILLCTDGLYGLVDDEELLRETQASDSPENILERLVELANERGGIDNITAILVTAS